MSNYISDQFRQDLADFGANLIQRADKIRSLKQQIDNLESGITWAQKEIARLDNDKSRRTHAKHKSQLNYQIRHMEIELAFTLNDYAQVPESLKKFYGLI